MPCMVYVQPQARLALAVGEYNSRPQFTQRTTSRLHVDRPGMQLRLVAAASSEYVLFCKAPTRLFRGKHLPSLAAQNDCA
jgi:hypothetical protein